MTRSQKVGAAIVAMAVIIGVTAGGLLMSRRAQARPPALVFERYGHIRDLDFNIQDVAFLWFTNSSAKSYCLPMLGSTNTFHRDEVLGEYDIGSYLIRWEFGDPAKPMPQVSFASLGVCLVVAPNSAVRLRIPMPPQGQQRKVAVLCAEQPSGTPRAFWTKGVGLRILRALPRSTGRNLLFPEPPVLRVWGDRELSNAGEGNTKR